MEQVKAELRALNTINQKRKWTEQGAPSKDVNQKKSTPAPFKRCPTGLTEPYRKCKRTNHTTPKCRVGTNKCICVVARNIVVKLLASPRQGSPPSRPAAVERAYVMRKKGATTFGTVVTGAIFLNLEPFCVLFDSGLSLIHI